MTEQPGADPGFVPPQQPPEHANQPAYYGWQPRPKAETANSAMIWGIVSLAAAFIMGLPGLLGIVAIVNGNRAKRDIAASGGQLDGDSEATIGQVLGWIAVVVASLAILVVLAIVAIVVVALIASA